MKRRGQSAEDASKMIYVNYAEFASILQGKKGIQKTCTSVKSKVLLIEKSVN